MSKMLRATFFITLMVGLSWWVVAVVPQQGVSGASNLPLVNQVKQNTQNNIHLSQEFDNSIDNSDVILSSTTELTHTINLPMVVTSFCATGEDSNNIADAWIICSGQTVSGQVNDNDWDDVYKIWTVANQQLTISMNGTGVGGPGDADLYLYPPGTTDVNTDPYSDSSENIGNSEFIQGTVLVGGFWYVDVFDCCDGDGGTNYNLTVTVSGPGATGAKTFNLTGIDRLQDRGRFKASD